MVRYIGFGAEGPGRRFIGKQVRAADTAPRAAMARPSPRSAPVRKAPPPVPASASIAVRAAAATLSAIPAMKKPAPPAPTSTPRKSPPPARAPAVRSGSFGARLVRGVVRIVVLLFIIGAALSVIAPNADRWIADLERAFAPEDFVPDEVEKAPAINREEPAPPRPTDTPPQRGGAGKRG